MTGFSSHKRNKGRITPDSAYNRQPPKSPPLRGAKREGVGASCANHENKLTGAGEGREYGGDRGDAVFGKGAPRLGMGKEGSKLAVANRSPKNAHDFASFDGVGGEAKKPTLG